VIELGGRDIEGGVVTVTRRDDPELGREQIPRSEAGGLAAAIEEMQQLYFSEARQRLEERTATGITDVESFKEWFSREGTDASGFVRAPWSQDRATEEVMAEFGVSVRCIPFEQNVAAGAKCVISGAPAKVEAVFAKAY
jgi:prolyl-tRNA synthetase